MSSFAIAQKRGVPQPSLPILLSNDTTCHIEVPGFRLRFHFPRPERGFSKATVHPDSSGGLDISIGIQYDLLYIGSIRLATSVSTIAASRKFDQFIAAGGELHGDGMPAETIDHYGIVDSLFHYNAVNDEFRDFTNNSGRRFIHRRNHDEPCGCWVDDAFTFIDSVRIYISLTADASELSNRVWEIMKPEPPKTRTQSDSSGLRKVMRARRKGESVPDPWARHFEVVSDSLRPAFSKLLSQIRIEKY